MRWIICHACRGEGTHPVYDFKCGKCDGEGYVLDEEPSYEPPHEEPDYEAERLKAEEKAQP